ncbi:MAG TPA: PQQ-dependent sugar dehydrogenase, partial [Chthoniobacteraceae bacterium]|nr:PQQ-dependent sugar dehydrogenase [Chthoniobacteraceae bacterium]
VDGSGNSTYNGFTFPNNKVRTEWFAIGFRNPWRMNFDPPTGRLFVGDVGQDNYEEVDIVTNGFNGGWSWREGLQPHTPATPPATPPAGFLGANPIYAYSHGSGAFQGNAVIGGVISRGDRLPELFEAYICCDNTSGNIWALRPATPTWSAQNLMNDTQISSIGTDPRNGDVLFCDLNSGQVKRLARSGTSGTPLPMLLSETGAFSNLATLTPNAGIVSYEPNVPFWSDYAIKSRWFAIKNLTDTVAFSENGNWMLPTGMVWIKHFDIDVTRGNPATRRKLETRFLVKTATNVYGIVYKWRADQTDADLVAEDGLTELIPGSSPPQTWRYPSRTECRICHTSVAGFTLSFNTRQMNRTHTYGAQTPNQIAALSSAGYFSASVANVNSLPFFAAADDTSKSREFRVRSYLAVNCVQCHQPGGAALGNWDARATTPTDAAQLINGLLVNSGTDAANRWAVPGDLAHSVAAKRLQGAGFARMPPLATNELDLAAIQLLSDWITLDLPQRQSFTQWQTANFGSPANPDAAPNADPERDGQTNAFEFLAGTSPMSPEGRWTLDLQTAGGDFQLSFTQPANRAVLLETSLDLANWSLWNVPGNQPLFNAAEQMRTLVGPMLGPQQFFRARLFEQ